MSVAFVDGRFGLQNRPGIRTVVGKSNEIDKSIGCRLRDKRTSIGWSQQELAQKLQIDPKEISAYEKGAKRISADHLLRLSKVLGVRPVYFFGIDGKVVPLPQEGSHLTLPNQGLRLHRAFVGVKNSALREAIVSLAIELAKNDSPA
jgi:transcriptional regulator with XRE-family HTH domain